MIKFRDFSLFCLICVGSLALGCGSSGSESGTQAGAASSGSFNSVPGRFIVGRVSLGQPLAGARVLAVGPDGSPLKGVDLVTDQNGLFFLRQPLPPGSRIIVTSAQPPRGLTQNVQLEVSVDQANPDQWIHVNGVLHLVCALVKENPGLSYLDAVKEVKRLLGIDGAWDLGILLENEASPFHHTAFLQAAAQAGGLEPLTQQLLILSRQGGNRKFRLAGETGQAGNTLGEIVNGVASGLAGTVGRDLAGWIVRELSSAIFGPPDPFSDITGQFQSLSNQIALLGDQFRSESVYQSLQQNVTNPIGTAISNLSTAAASFVPPSPPLSLYSLGPAGSQLLQALQTANYQSSLNFLLSTLTGSDDLITNYPNSPAVDLRPERVVARLTYPIVGIDSVLTRMGGYGAFSAKTTLVIEAVHKYYLAYATLAANLLVETAHATVDGIDGSSPSLAQACREAQLRLLGTSESVPGLAARRKQVQQLLPPSLSQVAAPVFIDREYGLMWFTVAIGNLDFATAQSLVQSFRIGPYSGWRLPYEFELEQLYSRINAGYRNRTPNQRQGKEATVLTDLGFDLSNMTDAHQVWGIVRPFGETNPVRYSLDTGNVSYLFATGRHDVLLVRSYSETLPTTVFTDPELLPVENAPLKVDAQTGAGGVTRLKASTDFSCPIGGTFTISGKTIVPQYGNDATGFPPVPIQGHAQGSLVNGKDITDRVVWKSSNDSMALVSNLEGEEGTVYWRTPAPGGSQTCTFTATFQDKAGSVTVQRPSDLQWVVDSILLTPNQSSVSFAQNPTQQVVFIATVFLKNPATGDRTVFRSSAVGGEAPAPPVTWALEKTDGTPIPGGFTNPSSSILTVRSTDTTDSSVVVKATAGGLTVQTPLYLLR